MNHLSQASQPFTSNGGTGSKTIINDALKYIDEHLDEAMSLELLAEKFGFSTFYFHRLFSAVVGKSLAAFIRDRRILLACILLYSTEKSVLDIALDCGFQSAQAFSRAFKDIQGLPPREYRRQKYQPVVVTVDELIMKFTNRLKGGILVNPNIIRRDKMIIAGVQGPGDRTGEVWQDFMRLSKEKPLNNLLSESGYEIRIYENEECKVFVGNAVKDKEVDSAYSLLELPASKYASFDVYVANGYESENQAMAEWLETNKQGYSERFLEGKKHYCVEYYDERFDGEEAGSIVEIWIPIVNNSVTGN